VAQRSSIEWTESTWNPVTGCSKISPGCKFCYAKRMADRLKAMGQPRYRDGFAVRLQEDLIDLPLRWREPRIVFVNSMSDLFHEDIPESFILRCFQTMNIAKQHTFQVLTKRPTRCTELAKKIDWTSNIWIGTSIESAEYSWRSSSIASLPAAVRFLSIEPLLSAIPNLPLKSIDWAIVGGESGPGARPMDPDWVRQIRDRCVAQNVPFFFKQWGGVRKSRTGRTLDGRTWDELPVTTREAGNGQRATRNTKRLGRSGSTSSGRRRTANSPVRILGSR
jgi:protein gp37